MHEEDKIHMQKNRYDFQSIIFYWFNDQKHEGGAIVIESKVIYVFNSSDQIVKGVLTSQDNATGIRSNVPYYKIDGPRAYGGQDKYILFYTYKDQDFDNFHMRQLVYQNPIVPVLNLVNDQEGTSTKFTTFLNNGSILGYFDTKFLKFDSDGYFQDVVEFHGHSN